MDIVELQDSVVDYLNGQVFGLEFTAQSRVHPLFEREDTVGLEVVVTTGPSTWTKVDRAGTCEVLTNIPVVIRSPVTEPETEIGPLLELVDDIKHSLIAAPVDPAAVVGLTQSEPYSLESLETEGLFQAIVTLQIKGFR